MKYRLLLIAGVVLVSAQLTAAEAAFTPAPHPNHYILVVDASFSTVETPRRAEAYRWLLEERLPEILTSEGFGGIPPAVPGRDFITLVTFGIVLPKYDYREAYRHLHEYSFQRDFIHPIFVYQPFSPEQLRAVIWPRQFYQLTVLLWAKKLAVASLPAMPDAAVNRTFVIELDDGEPNEGVVQKEKQMAT